MFRSSLEINLNDVIPKPTYDTVKPKEFLTKNPFVHKLEWNDTYDKIKTGILTIILLPFRSICVMFLLVIAWTLANIGLMGISKDELREKPLTGWRRLIKGLVSKVAITMCLFGGLGISIKGRQCKRSEAPILVCAPHSSFIDAILIHVTNMSIPLIRKEDKNLGKLIDFTQPIYVCREDKNSRQKTLNDITTRALSDLDWQQILIFPEGTCTNRSSLIQFKQGAFAPGLPIQPVIIRYPNKVDTVTWTWDGPEVSTLIWRTFTQFHTHCEVEFLPVYVPNEKEKENPKYYADNVQKHMAEALNVPTSEYSYEDCKLMTFARKRNIPRAHDLAVTQLLRRKLGLSVSTVEEDLARTFQINDSNCYIGLYEFAEHLKFSPMHDGIKRLFNVFQQVAEVDEIDMREYLLCAFYLNTANKERIMFIEYLFLLFGTRGSLNYHQFKKCMVYVPDLPEDRADELFVRVSQITNTGAINLEALFKFVVEKPRGFEDVYQQLCSQ